MPAGMTFRGQDTNVVYVGASDTIGVRIDMDEELAYQITKCIFDHYDELVPMHAAFKGWPLKGATVSWAAPYHPGAIRYYREKGIWDSEAEAKQASALKDVKG